MYLFSSKFLSCILFAIIFSPSLKAKSSKEDFYQIKIYYVKNNTQIFAVDEYLKNAFIPALHRAGIKKIGVFKPISNDTARVKKIYVLIPFHSMGEWQNLPSILDKDGVYNSASKSFTDAISSEAPFDRVESILLKPFPMHLHYEIPDLKSPVADRIYELRSYESPTEHLHKTKVKMFNEGGEISLFKKLGFNAVFYASVISGNKMPNLMYMTTFENMAEHDAHWKAFGNSPDWKKLSAMPEYENKVSVSRNESILMHPTEYSDF